MQLSLRQVLVVVFVFEMLLIVADGRPKRSHNDDDDNNNEVLPDCSPGYTRCATTDRCVHDTFFCDGDNDCGDNSDENIAFCRQRSCDAGQVKCDDGQCLETDEFCSEQAFCRDGSIRRNRDLCPDIEPSFDVCLDVVIGKCTRPFTAQWAGTDLRQKIIETDMSDICRSLNEVKQCADSALAEDCDVRDAAVMPDYYRQFRTDYETFLDIVCRQEMGVIGRQKACLLGINSRNIDMFGMVVECTADLVAQENDCETAYRSTEFYNCLSQSLRSTCATEAASIIFRHQEQVIHLVINYYPYDCQASGLSRRRGLIGSQLAKKSYGYRT